MMSIVLASGSPRRAELLAQLGVKFAVAPADIDERPFPKEQPLAYVRRMACSKAAVALEQLGATHMASGSGPEAPAVLAADTIVVTGAASYALPDVGVLLGKPVDRKHALEMLSRLSGRTHQVYTGLALQLGVQQVYACVCTHVSFRSVSVQEARAYWETGEPRDKAGGYGIQGGASKFVKKIDGSYSNVVGLPLFETQCALRALDLVD